MIRTLCTAILGYRGTFGDFSWGRHVYLQFDMRTKITLVCMRVFHDLTGGGFYIFRMVNEGDFYHKYDYSLRNLFPEEDVITYLKVEGYV